MLRSSLPCLACLEPWQSPCPHRSAPSPESSQEALLSQQAFLGQQGPAEHSMSEIVLQSIFDDPYALQESTLAQQFAGEASGITKLEMLWSASTDENTTPQNCFLKPDCVKLPYRPKSNEEEQHQVSSPETAWLVACLLLMPF